jgi:hypothetical protein
MCWRGKLFIRLVKIEVSPGDFFVVSPGVIHDQRITEALHRIFYWGIAVGD